MDLWQKIEIAGAVAGLIYIWLEYRASVWLWLAGIVMPAIYIYVYLHQGIYANVAMNVYFVIAGAYGLIAWRRGGGGEKPITRMPRRFWLPAIATGGVLTVAILLVLRHLPKEWIVETSTPWMDAFTTGFSVVALWMLSKKWAEQWLVWIVVDAVYTVMFYRDGLYFTTPVYAIFFIVAIMGYFKWRREAL